MKRYDFDGGYLITGEEEEDEPGYTVELKSPEDIRVYRHLKAVDDD